MTLLTNIFTSVLCLCSTFKIQMYWQQGYTWQEQDTEFQEFCWMRNYFGLSSFGICWYGQRWGVCWPDAVYISRCRLEEPRQMWTFVDLRAGEFLIKAPTRNQCLQRTYGNNVRMRLCNPFNDDQRWEGSTSKNRFSVSQGGKCLGQKHHPKNGEVIELASCNTLLKDETLYVEKTYL